MWVKDCDACNKHTYEGDWKPLLCGQCRSALYCSKECQLKHWPQHKKLCRLVRQSNAELDQRAMTHDGRQSNAMEADGRAYRPEINGELSMLAFRSALHLGKPTQRNHSHLVHLLLTWHPKHAELRRRFTLERAVVMTWEEVLARAGGARPEKLGPFRAAVPSAEALEARKNHSAHIMYCSAVFEIWDEAQEASCMIMSDQHGIELNTFPFGLDLAINERWEKTLRTSLAQPKAPRDDTLPMADLCASDTNEGLPNLLKEAMGPPDIQRLAMDAMSEAEFEIRMADTMTMLKAFDVANLL